MSAVAIWTLDLDLGGSPGTVIALAIGNARATEGSERGGHFMLDVAVTVGATLLALALGAATLRRRTP